MAPRGPLPGVRAVVRRQRRRRGGRPAGAAGPTRPSRLARRRRPVAEPDHALTQRRLGLRRRRLLRRAARIRHHGRSRRGRRGGWTRRHPGPARPRPQPHQRPSRVVRRVALGPGLEAPRLVRVGRPQARRLCPEQLGGLLRRPGVDPRPSDRAVLPAQLPARAARPQLVVRRGARRLRRHPALLVGPRRGRVPHRRVQHDGEGRGACATTRPPPRTTPSSCRCSASVPVYNGNRPEVHDVLRRWRAISDGYDPPRLLLGETNVDTLENLASYYGSGDDELHLAFNFPFIEAPFEAAALSDIVERTEALLPVRGVAGVDGLEPRRVAPGHPVVRRRPRQGAPGPAHAPHPAGHARALPGRRDRADRRRVRPRRSCSTRSGCGSGRTTRAATPSARPCRGTAGPTPASPRRG